MFDTEEKKLSLKMMTYWSNFAKYGLVELNQSLSIIHPYKRSHDLSIGVLIRKFYS